MNKLKYYRELKGLSRKQLSIKSGVSVRTIEALEYGFRKIDSTAAKTIYLLSDALGLCLMEDLLDIESYKCREL